MKRGLDTTIIFDLSQVFMHLNLKQNQIKKIYFAQWMKSAYILLELLHSVLQQKNKVIYEKKYKQNIFI